METERRGLRTSSMALGLTLVVAIGVAPLAAQAPAIGTVKVAAGSALVVREGRELQARPGLALLESDTVRTGADGRLGLTLRDETRLSLGPGTSLHLARFAYAPAEQRLGLTLRFVRGAAAYVSGRIAELAPGSVTIETPRSVIGVRGTHLLISVAEP